MMEGSCCKFCCDFTGCEITTLRKFGVLCFLKLFLRGVCVLIGFAKIVVDVRAPVLGDINIARMTKIAK